MPTVEDIHNCTGCSACQTVCPQQCIKMLPDHGGFLSPRIDADSCIECSACYEVCPLSRETAGIAEPAAFAAWSLDEETRYRSTSGGVFSELANVVLGMRGSVVGARYDGVGIVCHDMIDSPSQIAALRQSKYVQSEKRDIHRRTLEALSDGRLVLFVGSPCECAGLAQLTGGAFENLIMCDFICRGAISPFAYRSYLKYLETRYASRAVGVWFKNKGISWNRFSTRVDFADGGVYLADRYHDLYMRGYLEANLYSRESCSECRFKGLSRVSDITLADFWGVESMIPTIDSSHGVSLVLANTGKGRELLSSAADRIASHPVVFQDAIRGNLCYGESVARNPKASEFFRRIGEGEAFDDAIRPYLRKSIGGRLRALSHALLARIRRMMD